MNDATSIEAAVASAGDLLDIDGVHGVGEGESDGSPCVLVLVSHIGAEQRAALPDEIDGYPVVVRDIGEPPTAFDADGGDEAGSDIEPDCG